MDLNDGTLSILCIFKRLPSPREKQKKKQKTNKLQGIKKNHIITVTPFQKDESHEPTQAPNPKPQAKATLQEWQSNPAIVNTKSWRMVDGSPGGVMVCWDRNSHCFPYNRGWSSMVGMGNINLIVGVYRAPL